MLHEVFFSYEIHYERENVKLTEFLIMIILQLVASEITIKSIEHYENKN